MTKTDHWIPKYWNSSTMFSDHRQYFSQAFKPSITSSWQDWPDCNELNRLWPNSNRTLSGYLTRFMPQSSLGETTLYYEEHIFSTGEIPTRAQNWHDFFNAQVWLQFPKIKSVINAQHVEEIAKNGLRHNQANRSRKRDALTLFDESGVIFVSSDEQVIKDLKNHHWETLFWKKRQQWWQSISVYIVGHSLYEKALSPYVGMTAKALPLLVEESFFDQNITSKTAELDNRIANEIKCEKLLELPSSLCPLPVLGIPQWWPQNNDLSFYANKDYFRPVKK